MQTVTFSPNVHTVLCEAVTRLSPDRTFVLVDEHTRKYCLPLVKDVLSEDTTIISINPGDEHKTLESLGHVWATLSENRATRHSLLVNLGGGMVTDLGGFAAATFKRGIRFLNLPTTLLGMVDAAVGGKTGINFNGLKNEIGAFREAEEVIVHTPFLHTIDKANLLSGFAEMIKHSLLKNREVWASHLHFNPRYPDWEGLSQLINSSITIKRHIVLDDPEEHGPRKALNLGHTFGHALESLALEQHRPVLHGYAVAWGLVCELFLSTVQCGFPSREMQQTTRYIVEQYGRPLITCKDYPHLYELMMHDKKNTDDHINFTLLGDFGNLRLDSHVSHEAVNEALDFLREG